MQATQPVIETMNLTKAYGGSRPTLALDDLTLSVEPGEIFGFLGPNGAGKTTTIRLLLDLIRPTEGMARLFGQDVRAESVALHRRIGYLPAELALWDRYTGRQVVAFAGRVRGGADMAYVRQLADRLLLDLNVRVRSYSSGNRRKLGLVLALMHRPELLILDEPTNGLDPLVQQTFYQLMRETRQEGRTVFLSSHVLSEVQTICDRVGILRGGQLKAVERVSQLIHADFRWVAMRFRDTPPVETVASIPGVSELRTDENSLTFQLIGDFAPVLDATRNAYVLDIRTREPSLEEIFLTFYGETPNDAAPRQESVR